jgi:hypothetical protein
MERAEAQCNGAVLCCCGNRNGNSVELYRCNPQATLWPTACVVGPDWGCIPLVFALITAPTIVFIIFV